MTEIYRSVRHPYKHIFKRARLLFCTPRLCVFPDSDDNDPLVVKIFLANLPDNWSSHWALWRAHGLPGGLRGLLWPFFLRHGSGFMVRKRFIVRCLSVSNQSCVFPLHDLWRLRFNGPIIKCWYLNRANPLTHQSAMFVDGSTISRWENGIYIYISLKKGDSDNKDSSGREKEEKGGLDVVKTEKCWEVFQWHTTTAILCL